MGNPLKRGADPYADAGETQGRILTACSGVALVVSGANTSVHVAPVNGKLKRVTGIVTVATTVAVALITVNIDGNDLAATFSVPVTAINLALTFDIDIADVDNVVLEGSLITLTSNAGATAGAVFFTPYIAAVN